MANENTNEINKVLNAIAHDKNIPWKEVTSVVKVPGRYNVYSCGTTGDVTLLVWIHKDGSTRVKYVCW